MENKILFEITEDQLETGLRGIPVGYCTTSVVDPLKGIFYREHSIEEVAHLEPEEVIYLIFYGKIPDSKELLVFKEELKKRRDLHPKTVEAIEALPQEGHPMKLLSMALLISATHESGKDYMEEALNMIAKAPSLVALVINHHYGVSTNLKNCPEEGYIERFYTLLNLPKGNKKEMLSVLKLFYNLHMDHGGGNLSTFVGKAVASSLEDMWGSMTAAMCALEGPRHGRANQDALEFAEALLKEIYTGKKIEEQEVREALNKRLDNHELIFGFGHAVLKVEDPRAAVLYQLAEASHGEEPLIQLILLLRKIGSEVLKENPKIHDPYPNVDAISGSLLKVSGFPYPEYFTVLFGFSRMVGIARQIVYERLEAREGKGTPIVRPKYIYKKES